MTDDSKTKRDENDLVLDWDDDAVDSWSQELDGTAIAEAAPFPASPEVQPKVPAPVGLPLPKPAAPAVPQDFFAKRHAPPLPSLPPLPPLPGTGPNTLRPGGLQPASTPRSVPPAPLPAMPRGSAPSSLPPLPSLRPDTRKTSAPPAMSLTHNEKSDLSGLAPRTESERPRMYKPPSDQQELKELKELGNRTLPPPAGNDFSSAWLMDDEEGDSTRIASIPQELIDALGRKDAIDQALQAVEQTADLSGLFGTPDAPEEAAEPTPPESQPLDVDEAFSLRSSLYPIAPDAKPESEAPQLEVSELDDDDDEDFDDNFDETDATVIVDSISADLLAGDDIEEETTGVHSLPPVALKPASARPAAPALPKPKGLGLPKPAFALPKMPPPVAKNDEPSVLRNLDELAPPEELAAAAEGTAPAQEDAVRESAAPAATSEQSPASAAAQSADDAQVVAALRKLRAKRKRAEVLPLAGTDQASKLARVELLSQLASQCIGVESATLLTTAGELAEEVGDTELAQSLYERARTQAPDLEAAHQGLGRVAFATGTPQDYINVLERRAKEAQGPEEKARALTLLARFSWLVLQDAAAALSSAKEAQALEPTQVGHALLAARIEGSISQLNADGSLARAAELLTDSELSAGLWSFAGLCLEQRGELQKARDYYQRAASVQPGAFGALLGLSRTELAADQAASAASALQTLSDALPDGSLKEAARRRAAVLASLAQKTPEAFAHQEASQDAVYLRSLAEFALRRDDAQHTEQAVRSWSETAHGSERALALLTLAELEATAGKLDAAESALSQALESDPTLTLVPAVRELLSRKHGILPHAATPADDALQTATRLVRTPEQLGEEVAALLSARNLHWVPECTDAILLDAALEAGDVERARTNLSSEAERGTVEERVSALLSLADHARRHGDEAGAREALQTAYDLDSRNVLAGRALLRATIPTDQRVRLLRREAESASGARTAFLLLRAGRAPSEGETERLDLLTNAYESSPSYAPATWALHQEGRRQGDIERLADLHAREAGRATDPHEAIAHLVRAALVRAGADADAAAAQLTRALDLMPADPVLRELVIRLGDAVPATLRAEAIQSSAERAPTALKRPATLAAAAAFEDANQPLRALKLFESVLAEHPGDPIAEMGAERVAKAAGETAQILADARKRLSEPTDTDSELRLTETLFRWEESKDQKRELAERLLALSPGHAGALRRLEITAMEANDLAALEQVETCILGVSQGPKDRLSRLRLLSFLSHLRGAEASTPDALDALVVNVGTQADKGLWLGRSLLSAAEAETRKEAKRELLAKATALMLASTTDRTEQSSLAAQQARHLLAVDPAQAAVLLEPYREAAASTHPTLEETLAEAYAASGKRAEAARMLEACAGTAATKRRAARLYYRAGDLYQEFGDVEAARRVFTLSAEADITYADVESKLEGLLSSDDDLTGLIALAEAKLRNETAPEARAEGAVRLAGLYEKQGALEKAQDTLREALEFAPEHLKALSQLATLLGDASGQQRERAELLIRVARLSRDPDELCDVFFKLGVIYDDHMPDARRAEAAYRRVLKLAPRHQSALERLSALLKRTGQTDAAAEVFERLIYIAERPEQKRDVSFELSRLREDAGELREAEDVLERLRKTAPTDVTVLREMAEFYRRGQTPTALAMHLNRSINDLRQAVLHAPSDSALWLGLVEMLDERGRKDAACATAAAAYAAEVSDPKLTRMLTSDGSHTGLEGVAFSERLDDLLFPNLLPPALRILFRHGAEAMGRASPLDLKALAAEKLERKHPLRALALEFTKAAGLPEAELYITSQLPRAFVPVSDAPLTILIGKTILELTNAAEQRFLMARACKIAKSQMSLTCRLRPEELALLLAGLLHAQVPTYRSKRLEAAAIEETSRRVQKQLSRKAREELLPHAVELSAQPELDLSAAYVLASTAGNRAALLATGNVAAGLSALCKLSGSNQAKPSLSELSAFDEARELLTFSISEPHFEARQRAGAERR